MSNYVFCVLRAVLSSFLNHDMDSVGVLGTACRNVVQIAVRRSARSNLCYFFPVEIKMTFSSKKIPLVQGFCTVAMRSSGSVDNRAKGVRRSTQENEVSGVTLFAQII